MAQVRGQGTERSRRHAEDEENDDGWSDVVLIAPGYLPYPLVTALSFQGWPLRWRGVTGGGIKKWVLQLGRKKEAGRRGLQRLAVLYLVFSNSQRSIICEKYDLMNVFKRGALQISVSAVQRTTIFLDEYDMNLGAICINQKSAFSLSQ